VASVGLHPLVTALPLARPVGTVPVFCTCCFGLIAAIFCYMAMQASDQGNSVDAESKLRWGKIITIVGLVLGAVLTVMSLVYARDLAEAVRAALLGAAP